MQSWFYRIAHNVFVDHLGEYNTLEVDISNVELMSNSPVILENIEKDEDNKIVIQCLNRIPEEKRELIILSKFQGMKYEEISQITGMSVASIKVNVHRSILKIRDYYFEYNKAKY